MYIGSSCFSEPSAPTLSPFDTTLFIVTTLAFGLQGGACFRMYVCVCTQVWKSQDIISQSTLWVWVSLVYRPMPSSFSGCSTEKQEMAWLV